MRFMQKLGKAIMLPVACLPLCGILMGIGYLLCPASMQGGELTEITARAGLFLVKAGGALIDHIALMFAVGIGVGMAEDRDGTAALAALASWLMITTLLNPSAIAQIYPTVSEDALLAFGKIENPFIGILAGLIGSLCYNRFKDTKLPEWLAFFSGKRSTVIVAGACSILVSMALLFLWPALFGGLVLLGRGIAELGPVGAGLYAFLNRLLIPLGLHHALNNVFWFDTIGLGDLTHFWAGHTSADTTWSLGMYMSGFFPCMMFGVPGAVLAMVRSTAPEKRKVAVGLLVSAAICSFVCGVTEPFEFAFMFAAPVLYVIYAILYGVFTWVTALVGFRAGFAFSAGAIDLLFSASLPAAQKTWMILPLGAAAFVIFYLVFRIMITKFDLKTPGREEHVTDDIIETSSAEYITEPDRLTVEKPAVIIEGFNITGIVTGLGGKENIATLDNCITRLRVEVKNPDTVSEAILKKSGAKGVIKTGKTSLQVIIGMKVQSVADAIREQRY